LGQRVTLAKHAKSEEIQNFLYDNEIRIAEVLLDNPNISREDVLVMAQTTHVSEILEAIATHRKWKTFHHIIMAVLCNPQTLSAVSITLLQRLNINDLATIFYKRTIPAEVVYPDVVSSDLPVSDSSEPQETVMGRYMPVAMIAAVFINSRRLIEGIPRFFLF